MERNADRQQTDDLDTRIQEALANAVVPHRANPQPPEPDVVVWTHRLHPDHITALVPVVRELMEEAKAYGRLLGLEEGLALMRAEMSVASKEPTDD